MPKQTALLFFKSYPHHWVTDDKASALSLSAFGAWYKIVCYMWLAGDGSGVLEGNVRGLRRLLGADSDEQMEGIIKEMLDCGVGGIEKDGKRIIFHSPRMSREWAEAKSGKDRRKQYDTIRRGTDEFVPIPTNQKTTPKTSQYEGSDAVEMFTHYTGYNPPIAHAEQIRHRCKNLKMWDATVQAWISEGYKRTNVVNMIEKYESDVAPKAQRSIGDKAPSWRINEERLGATIRKKVCVICGSTNADVGGVIGDERCGKISCEAAPPPIKTK